MSRKASPSNASIEKAIAHIQIHWKSGKSLKEIAQLYHVDQGNLTRAFRNIQQLTPKEYIDRMRIEYIRERLSNDDVFGYQLATELGLPSDMSFYRWIKRAQGVSFSTLQRKIEAQSLRGRAKTIKTNKKG